MMMMMMIDHCTKPSHILCMSYAFGYINVDKFTCKIAAKIVCEIRYRV